MSQNLTIARIKILIVLYKKHYTQSAAIMSLVDMFPDFHSQGIDVEIYVWNNSPEYSPPLKLENIKWFEGCNEGLSYVYNKMSNFAFGDNATHFMISDDDTNYSSPSYIQSIASALSAYDDPENIEFGVILPKIYSKGLLISPGERYGFLGRLSVSLDSGLISSHNRLAINSGVIITRCCYLKMNPLYDERLMFYTTDTDFFVRYQSYYNCLYVLDAELQHDLSEHSADTPDRANFRFREMIHGLRIIFEKRNILFRLSLEIYLAISSVRKSINYKNFDFIMSYIVSCKRVV